MNKRFEPKVYYLLEMCWATLLNAQVTEIKPGKRELQWRFSKTEDGEKPVKEETVESLKLLVAIRDRNTSTPIQLVEAVAIEMANFNLLANARIRVRTIPNEAEGMTQNSHHPKFGVETFLFEEVDKDTMKAAVLCLHRMVEKLSLETSADHEDSRKKLGELFDTCETITSDEKTATT